MVARMKICCVTVIVSISKFVSSFCLVFLSEGNWTLNLRLRSIDLILRTIMGELSEGHFTI